MRIPPSPDFRRSFQPSVSQDHAERPSFPIAINCPSWSHSTNIRWLNSRNIPTPPYNCQLPKQISTPGPILVPRPTSYALAQSAHPPHLGKSRQDHHFEIRFPYRGSVFASMNCLLRSQQPLFREPASAEAEMAGIEPLYRVRLRKLV